MASASARKRDNAGAKTAEATKKKDKNVKSRGKGSGSTVIVLSLPSIAVIFALSTLSAFSLGRYLSTNGLLAFKLLKANARGDEVKERPIPVLPDPPLLKGKGVPFTRYTSQLFDNGEAQVRSSTALLNHDGSAEYVKDENGNQKCDMNLTKHSENPTQEATDESFEEGLYQPAGQHLLVDIKNVEAAFLDSEVRLATAMIDVITQSELTLLSYHCHGLIPEGVSCVGVLLESHVSFHTWPTEGVITLDLFTCGSKSLLPLVNVMSKLFGVPRESGEEPDVVWNHKKRGFRYTEDADVVNGLSDLDRFLGDAEQDKDVVFSSNTGIQQIDIYDSIEPRFRTIQSHRRSLENDGSYESRNPELFQKDRLFFLDGVLRSRRYGESAYHEAMVHPAMITHEKPERVVIVGGGEGAGLREILKHKTVKKVVMLEVDAEVTKAAKIHLSAWNDCSNFLPEIKSCFDDPRLEVHNVDAVEWFSKHFPSEGAAGEDLFDVVIIDALDPSTDTNETERLFGNEDFVESIFNALGEYGILAAQLGESDTIDSVPDSYWNDGMMMHFFDGLEEAGFESVLEYEEMHGRVTAPMRYVAALKSRYSRAWWFGTEAEISLRLQKRIIFKDNGELPLRQFDAASMIQYQMPSRAAEERFCKGYPEGCGKSGDLFPSDVANHPITSFEVRTSSVGGGRGVFAKHDIAERDYLALDECVNQMFVPSSACIVLYVALKKGIGEFWTAVVGGYLEGYGVSDSFFGIPSVTVDPGILTFVNHGCDRTYNIGTETRFTEATIEIGQPVATVHDARNEVFNPHLERHYFSYDCTCISALRDISAGDEILDNYMTFGGGHDQADFDENLRELKSICQGSDGIVDGYEKDL